MSDIEHIESSEAARRQEEVRRREAAEIERERERAREAQRIEEERNAWERSQRSEEQERERDAQPEEYRGRNINVFA